MGTFVSISAPNDESFSSGTSFLTSMLNRLVGATVYVLTIGAPLSRRYVTVTAAGSADGFASRMKVSNTCSPPTRPSARPQRVPVLVTPELLWPSPNGVPPSGQYIDRSDTIATSDCTTVDS